MQPPRERSRLGAITFSLLLLVGGFAALLDVAEVIDVTAQGFLATALVVIGGALLAGGWYGRSRGLIPLGVIVALVLSAVAAVDLPLGGMGQRNWRPASASEIRDTYEFGVGEAELDLRSVALSEGVRDVRVRLGIGELRVVVPDDVAVEVDAHAGMAEVTVFDQVRSGMDIDVNTSGGEAPVLRLDVALGIGELSVRRASDPSAPRIQPDVER